MRYLGSEKLWTSLFAYWYIILSGSAKRKATLRCEGDREVLIINGPSPDTVRAEI